MVNVGTTTPGRLYFRKKSVFPKITVARRGHDDTTDSPSIVAYSRALLAQYDVFVFKRVRWLLPINDLIRLFNDFFSRDVLGPALNPFPQLFPPEDDTRFIVLSIAVIYADNMKNSSGE